MVRLALGLLLLVLSPLAAGQSRDETRVDGQAASGISGVASLNLAAGTGNAQTTLRAIAIGDVALARAFGVQAVDTHGVDVTRDAKAVITDSALGNVTGVVGLNQAAGGANAQANLIAIGTNAGVTFAQTVDESALAATAAPSSATTTNPTPAGSREARIDAGAIAAPTGVLQINQTAGVGNASTNAIVLQLPGGTP